MLVKNSKKKKIIKLLLALLVIFIISFVLVLILNEEVRTTMSKTIKEFIVANTIETKIDYDILPLERRNFKCTYNNTK